MAGGFKAMDTKYREAIVLFFAVLVVLIGFGYLFMVTFTDIPQSGQDHAKVIVGFILGTALTVIITYFWGSSDGSTEKSKTIDRKLNGYPPKE